MNTKRQEELVNGYLAALDEDTRPVYRELTRYLSELGYYPHAQRSYIVFKHDLHNKQMAKMGTSTRKNQTPKPYFALRFSACRGYSPRFADIARAAIEKSPSHAAKCVDGGCGYCQGEPWSHVYTLTLGGERRTHCGAYVQEIPNVAAEDLTEIQGLMAEEHRYLLRHEAGAGESN